jgi:hypothetical protein
MGANISGDDGNRVGAGDAELWEQNERKRSSLRIALEKVIVVPVENLPSIPRQEFSLFLSDKSHKCESAVRTGDRILSVRFVESGGTPI